jgi:hypothetical protein
MRGLAAEVRPVCAITAMKITGLAGARIAQYSRWRKIAWMETVRSYPPLGFNASPDHFIGSRQHIRRDRQVYCFAACRLMMN